MFANGFQWRDTATNQFYLPALSTFISMTHNVGGGGGVTGTESRNAYEQKKNCVGPRMETGTKHLYHIYQFTRRRKKHIWKANNRWFFNTIESVFSYRFIIHIWHLLNEAHLLLFAFNISKLFTYQLTDWNTFVHVQNCHIEPLKWKFHFINLSLCQMI